MARFAVNKAGAAADDEPATEFTPRSSRRRTTAVVAVAAVLLVAVGAVLADVALAIRGEYQLSRAVRASPQVGADPEVTLQGFPFVSHASSGSFDGAVIAAKGVTLPGCESRGGCRGELGATLGPFVVDDGWRFGPSEMLHTESIQAYTRLDAVTVARYLAITDLTVSTPAPEDKAGGGGPADGALSRTSGVLLTGTVALPPSAGDDPDDPPSASTFDGPTARVSVAVDLSVVDGRLRIEATGFYTGPERHADDPVPDDQRAAVLQRFSVTLPPIGLPWGVAPQTAQSFGGDIELRGSAGPRDLRPDQF